MGFASFSFCTASSSENGLLLSTEFTIKTSTPFIHNFASNFFIKILAIFVFVISHFSPPKQNLFHNWLFLQVEWRQSNGFTSSRFKNTRQTGERMLGEVLQHQHASSNVTRLTLTLHNFSLSSLSLRTLLSRRCGGSFSRPWELRFIWYRWQKGDIGTNTEARWGFDWEKGNNKETSTKKKP